VCTRESAREGGCVLKRERGRERGEDGGSISNRENEGETGREREEERETYREKRKERRGVIAFALQYLCIYIWGGYDE